MEVADMITKLQGIVTDKILISKLSFIDDVEAEIEIVQKHIKNIMVNKQKNMVKIR